MWLDIYELSYELLLFEYYNIMATEERKLKLPEAISKKDAVAILEQLARWGNKALFENKKSILWKLAEFVGLERYVKWTADLYEVKKSHIDEQNERHQQISEKTKAYNEEVEKLNSWEHTEEEKRAILDPLKEELDILDTIPFSFDEELERELDLDWIQVLNLFQQMLGRARNHDGDADTLLADIDPQGQLPAIIAFIWPEAQTIWDAMILNMNLRERYEMEDAKLAIKELPEADQKKVKEIAKDVKEAMWVDPAAAE